MTRSPQAERLSARDLVVGLIEIQDQFTDEGSDNLQQRAAWRREEEIIRELRARAVHHEQRTCGPQAS
ncbi:hypothetical protein [Luteipulveratus mongoliensis]|nr:hypothetical protein [Luteipulveratus mongoliensis]